MQPSQADTMKHEPSVWGRLQRRSLSTCVCTLASRAVLIHTVNTRRCGPDRSGPSAHLGAVQADDAVDVARAVVEVGDGDGVLAGGQPVLLGVGVDLEDVGPGAVDGLLPEGHEEEVVNLFVPQHQRLARPTAGAAAPIAHGHLHKARRHPSGHTCFPLLSGSALSQ
ncbi:hypothetical protein EYF80_059322 [Liparis tanakae]|uniref:Uncharacterized protein n=1 Tax=Liparis tanakae TaxID=230148 RepID=A0A4Z2ENL3_9TELE|nr:hypothetical protein EYF80_059322 [Liparis tanakae]